MALLIRKLYGGSNGTEDLEMEAEGHNIPGITCAAV